MTRFVRLLLCLLLAAGLRPARATPAAPLEVHFIDVGQGDSVLVRSPGGRTVLLDAGNTEAATDVSGYLDRLGVGRLDLAVVSHPHLDHLGGMLDVLRAHRPAAYMDAAYPHPLENYDELLRWLEDEKIPVRNATAGRVVTIEPGVTLEVLAPSERLFEGTRSDTNANTVVLRLVYGKTSFLLPGDAEDPTERRLLEQDAAEEPSRIASTVLKVAHHGGRYSTSDDWLARVAPEVAVISCGKINPYGHPTSATIGRLLARNVRVFRTDTDGDVVASSDGHAVTWRTTGTRSAKLDEPGGRRSFRRVEQEEPPAPAAARPAPPVMPEVPAATPQHRLDLNAARAEQLAALPGIGDGLAARIVEDRDRRGAFHSVEDLTRVPGVGVGIVERVRPLVSAAAASHDVAPARAGAPPERPEPEPARTAIAEPPPPHPSVPQTYPPRAYESYATVLPPPVSFAPAPGAAPPPPPVPGESAPAPRPAARPGVAYRTAGSAALHAPPDPVASGGRLFAGGGTGRANLNVSSAEALAQGAGISVREASLVVEARRRDGLFRALGDLDRIAGLTKSARDALVARCSLRLDLNSASAAELAALGLSQKTAAAVLELRRDLGAFQSLDDLEEVDGLEPRLRLKILPLVSVDRWSARR